MKHFSWQEFSFRLYKRNSLRRFKIQFRGRSLCVTQTHTFPQLSCMFVRMCCLPVMLSFSHFPLIFCFPHRCSKVLWKVKNPVRCIFGGATKVPDLRLFVPTRKMWEKYVVPPWRFQSKILKKQQMNGSLHNSETKYNTFLLGTLGVKGLQIHYTIYWSNMNQYRCLNYQKVL